MSRTIQRRASVYILVLGAGVLVIVMGVSAILLARTQGDATRRSIEKRAVRQAAIDGLALALHAAPADITARALAVSQPEIVDAHIGESKVSVLTSDPLDGDLDDSPTDPIRLQSSATMGTTYQSVSVDISPVYVPAPAAAFTLAVGGTVTLSNAYVDVLGDGYSGGNVHVGGSSFAVNNWTTGGTVTGTIDGTVTVAAAKVDLPAASTLDWLVSLATPISYASTGGTIQSVLISPSTNPYGAANPLGIYVISCGNNPLVIRNCRVVGTLIVLKPGNASRLEGSVLMSPASPEYPVLLVSGDFRAALTGDDLSELSILRNLNPSAAPYAGQWDIDTLDEYASVLSGTVIVTGDLISTGKLAVDGALFVGGNLTLSNQNWFRYAPVQGVTPGLSDLSRWSIDRTTLRRTIRESR